MTTPPTPRITVPAEPRYARILGLVADGLAADLGLDADRIDDLDLAIEEATETLAALDGATEVTLVVTDDGSVLRCELTATGPTSVERIEWDDLRTRVLQAVTDGIEVGTTPPRVTLLLSHSS